MSSPLRWFRKHEKLLLGFFGVMLMIVFTISFGSGIDPIVDSISGGNSMRADSALVSFKGGQLTRADVYNLRKSRFLLQPLLSTMQYRAYQENRQPLANPLPVNQTSDEGLLQLVLLSKEAERLGIQITDDFVLTYLKQLSADTVSPNEVLQMWKQVTNGEGSERQLLGLLRRELMAQQLIAMSESGAWPISPMRGWDYFNQLERFVSAEFLPIPVTDLVDKVPEPSEAELRKLYDQFKNKYKVPGSPDPGFKRRLRRAFDYVKLDYVDFLKAEKLAISDEQVREYYEKNREEFRETLPSSDLELDDELNSSADGTGVDEPKSSQPKEAGDTSPPTTSSTPTDNNGTNGEVGKPDDVNASAKDRGPAAGDDTPDNASSDPTEGSSSTSTQEAETSDQNSDDANAPDDAPSLTPVPQADQTPAGSEAQTKEPEEDDAPAVAAEVDSSTALADPQETPAAESNQTAATTDASEPQSEEQKEGNAGAVEEPTYRPLEDVADSIREKLAAPIAQQKMDKTLAQVLAQMDRYYRQYSYWQADKKSKDPQPPLPDLAKITSVVPIEMVSQPLGDELECESHELGQAYDFEISQQSYRQIPFAEVAYEENVSLYQPNKFPSGEAVTKFVYWVSAEEPAYVPAFSEIRDEVNQAWKVQQARVRAQAEAEELASEARGKTAPLSESLAAPDRRFFNTGDVTWMSTGNIGVASGALPRPSEIPGVAMAGDEFRKTMFRMAEGEVGVAFDAPQSTVYVIRINKISPDEKQLADMLFHDDSHATAFQYLQESSRYRLRSGWYQDLLKKYDVTWLHDPSRQDNS